MLNLFIGVAIGFFLGVAFSYWDVIGPWMRNGGGLSGGR